MSVPLLAELKRRRVFRALLGYAIVGFAVLQVIEPIINGLHLPEWTLSFVVVTLVVSFPVVLFLAFSGAAFPVFNTEFGNSEECYLVHAAVKPAASDPGCLEKSVDL